MNDEHTRLEDPQLRLHLMVFGEEE